MHTYPVSEPSIFRYMRRYVASLCEEITMCGYGDVFEIDESVVLIRMVHLFFPREPSKEKTDESIKEKR